MRNYDSEKHVKGESQFADDLLTPAGLLHIIVFASSVAHGKILKVDYSEALKSNGVAGIITAKDIPGENQIGGIIQDESLLAEEYVHFYWSAYSSCCCRYNSACQRCMCKNKD